jgi:hypothetical protein
MVVGAFELGGDLPFATFGGDTGHETAGLPAEFFAGRVRANIKLLGLDVEYPPPPGAPGSSAYAGDRAQVVSEEIRPAIAKRNDESVYWFDYGFHWAWVRLGSSVIASSLASETPTAKSDPRALRGFLEAMKSFASDPGAVEIEELIRLPSEFVSRADALREQIAALASPRDYARIRAVDIALVHFLNDLRSHLCTRRGADCTRVGWLGT